MQLLGWTLVALWRQRSVQDAALQLSDKLMVMTGIWLQIMESAAMDDQPQVLRLAAANSLRITRPYILAYEGQGTLSTSAEQRALTISNCMRAWILALKFLQDDDDEVRQVANETCCAALALNGEDIGRSRAIVVTVTAEVGLCIVYSHIYIYICK